MPFGRVILIVIDACGVGELPDAGQYGDAGAATLPHVAQAAGGLYLPALQKLGLGSIADIRGVHPSRMPAPCYGKMAEKSPGKDSTTGHWEIGGVILKLPFPVFPDGFPHELVREFEHRASVKTIGNIPASGTEIIKQLGPRHLETGEIILYTSADSVFQLAAHEDIYPLTRLYDICQIARDLLTGEYAVARVIARPFVGKTGDFSRTAGRKDFSLKPPEDTILDLMLAHGHNTLAVGKVYDLYSERGFSNRIKATNNTEVMAAVIDAVRTDSEHKMIVANCVDFDMLWGHRNDEQGFARGLVAFDLQLENLLRELRSDDLLIITADHGCDPTIKTSTDHTREYVPLLVHSHQIHAAADLGTRDTFADIAATIADVFGIKNNLAGKSFLNSIVS